MRSIVIAMAVALAAASWTEECQRHCTHDKNHLKSEALVSALGTTTSETRVPRTNAITFVSTAALERNARDNFGSSAHDMLQTYLSMRPGCCSRISRTRLC